MSNDKTGSVEVKRYTASTLQKEVMHEVPHGKYVEYVDYNALKSQLSQARARIEEAIPLIESANRELCGYIDDAMKHIIDPQEYHDYQACADLNELVVKLKSIIPQYGKA